MSWNWSQEKAKYFCWPRTAKIMGEFFFSHSFFSCSQCWCLTGSRLIFRILSFQLSILDRHILVASQKGWLPKLQTANITIQVLIKEYLLKKAFCVVITQHKMNEGLFIFEGFKIPLSKSSWQVLGVDVWLYRIWTILTKLSSVPMWLIWIWRRHFFFLLLPLFGFLASPI